VNQEGEGKKSVAVEGGNAQPVMTKRAVNSCCPALIGVVYGWQRTLDVLYICPCLPGNKGMQILQCGRLSGGIKPQAV